MFNLISAVFVFGKIKGAQLVIEKVETEPEVVEKKAEQTKGFWGFLGNAISKIGSIAKKVFTVNEYLLVQANIEHYSAASEEYKAEVVKILAECDEKLQALYDKYEKKETATNEDVGGETAEETEIQA